MAKEVAKKQQAGLPAGYDMDQLVQDAKSNPAMGAGDVALPFIALLQSNSPEVNPGHSEYIEGAQASMFMNTVSKVVFNGRQDGLLIVPCWYERRLVEWVHRDSGGGWVADYPMDHPIINTTKPDEKKVPRLPNGNTLMETAYHYILYMNPESGSWSQAMLGLKSTALKKSRALNNDITTSVIPGTDVQAPRYLYPYVMKSVFEQKGENSWWNYDFHKEEEVVLPEVYGKAKEYSELAKSGVINRTTDGTPYDPDTGEIKDDEIPV